MMYGPSYMIYDTRYIIIHDLQKKVYTLQRINALYSFIIKYVEISFSYKHYLHGNVLENLIDESITIH